LTPSGLAAQDRAAFRQERPMSSPVPRTNPFKRLLCIQVSPRPGNLACLDVSGDALTIDRSLAPELGDPGGALRLDDARLPDRILVVHGRDGTFRAYRNRCACGGFRIDPVPDEEKIRCCTLAQSTYDYSGRPISGPAKKNLDLLPTQVSAERLVIDLAPIRNTRPPHKR
jgi:nitrite reductase/ring-hydroxylating ferredoxin subunit